jgi:hypothetical protein
MEAPDDSVIWPDSVPAFIFIYYNFDGILFGWDIIWMGYYLDSGERIEWLNPPI